MSEMPRINALMLGTDDGQTIIVPIDRELLGSLRGRSLQTARIYEGDPSNPHCSNCGDTRGGPVGHEISECTWVRP